MRGVLGTAFMYLTERQRQAIYEKAQRKEYTGSDKPTIDFAMFRELALVAMDTHVPDHKIRMWFDVMDHEGGDKGRLTTAMANTTASATYLDRGDASLQRSEFMNLDHILKSPIALKLPKRRKYFPTLHWIMTEARLGDVWQCCYCCCKSKDVGGPDHPLEAASTLTPTMESQQAPSPQGGPSSAETEVEVENIDVNPLAGEESSTVSVGVDASAVGDAAMNGTAVGTLQTPVNKAKPKASEAKGAPPRVEWYPWDPRCLTVNNLATYVAIVSIGATTYGALSEPTRSDLQCDADLRALETALALFFTTEVVLSLVAHSEEGDPINYFRAWTRWIDVVCVTLNYYVVVVCGKHLQGGMGSSLYFNRGLRLVQIVRHIKSLEEILKIAMRVLPSIYTEMVQFLVWAYIFICIGIAAFAGVVTKTFESGGPGDWQVDRINTTLWPNATCYEPSPDGPACWSNYDMAGSHYADLNFDSFDQAKYTVFVLIIQNNWNSIAQGFSTALRYSPGGKEIYGSASNLYFFVFILFMSFIMVNIVMGIIIDMYDYIKEENENGLDSDQVQFWNMLKLRLEETPLPSEDEFQDYEDDNRPWLFTILPCFAPKQMSARPEAGDRQYDDRWEISTSMKAYSMYVGNYTNISSLRTDKVQEVGKTSKQLYDTMPVAVYMKNTDGKYVYVNNKFAAMHSSTVHEMTGMYEDKVLSPDMAKLLHDQTKLIITSGIQPRNRHPIKWKTHKNSLLGEIILGKFQVTEQQVSTYGFDGSATKHSMGTVTYLIPWAPPMEADQTPPKKKKPLKGLAAFQAAGKPKPKPKESEPQAAGPEPEQEPSSEAEAAEEAAGAEDPAE